MSVPRARLEAEHPYRADHRTSVSRSMAERAEMPAFRGLLRWFMDRWAAEVPGRVHVPGVEWEKPGRIVRSDGSVITDPGGGSGLGSPRLAPSFRAHVFGSDFATEQVTFDGQVSIGESYASPMRATITWLERNRHPIIAAWLRALGRNGGDWHTVTASADLPDEYGEAITRDALTLCWKSFREEPTESVA